MLGVSSPTNFFNIAHTHLPTLASSTFLQHSSHQLDEHFINRSLLDSVDAQADAEPIHPTSDSDQPAPASYSSTSDSSSGSPSVAYPLTMHSQHQHQPRPDSPHENNTQNMLHHLHSQDSLYSIQASQTGLYNNSNLMHHSSEYPNDFDHAKIQQQHKLNGFGPNSNYRASFSSFPNTTRTRHQTNQSFLNQTSFRDLQAHFPTSSDAFQNHLTSPVPTHMQTYESRASYDFGNGQSGLVSGPKYLVEPYGPSSAMVQPHHNPIKAGVQQATYATVSQYTNGVHLSSQTPYGPHVPTSGPTSSSAGIGINAGSGVSSGSGTLSMGNGANSSSNLEEISTIFVVGFPEDMQVCNQPLCTAWLFD